MAVTDVSALRERRKKKKLTKFMKRLIIILIAAGAILAIVLTKNLWYPKLDGILTKIPAAENTAELAEGYFPLSIEGGASYQLLAVDNCLALADDSHFFVYNTDGKIISSAQHTFSNPIITAGDKKVLLYDLGGKSFSLYSKYKNVYTKTTDEPILIARLGSGDAAAIVTKSEKYPSVLMVYDGNGKNIFNYRSVSRIIDVTFNSDSSGCYITTISVSGGYIVSKMIYYRFDRIDRDDSGNPMPVWETENIETLALSAKTYGDGIMLLGDTMFAYFNSSGKLIKTYQYKRQLVDYSMEGNAAAMIFVNEERRTSELVTVDCSTGNITEKPLDHEVLNVQINGNTVYLQNRDGIGSFTMSGERISGVELDTDYKNFCRISDYIYLLGYDEINRIDYN